MQALASRQASSAWAAVGAGPAPARMPLLRPPPLRRHVARATTEEKKREGSTAEGKQKEEAGGGTTDSGDDAQQVLADLQAKFEATENKPQIALFTGGAILAVVLINKVLGAVNHVPVLPKLLELVGLAYTGWFIQKYALYKEGREELLVEVEELKERVLGAGKQD